MRKFMVNVNGVSYEVEVEEISGANAAPKVVPVAQSAPVAKATPVAASAGQETINSPMPGTILDVKVKAGDVVKSGQVLIVLEAMKMENEIVSPRDGKIAAVNVAKGATVGSGDALCIIA